MEAAAKDEASAVREYGHMSAEAMTPADRDLLWSIQQDEAKHRELLRRMEERMPKEEIVQFDRCNVNDPTGCELSVSLGFAHDMGEADGIPTPDIDRMLEAGEASPQDARAALDRFVEAVETRFPGDEDRAVSAKAVVCSAFPDDGDCKDFWAKMDALEVAEGG